MQARQNKYSCVDKPSDQVFDKGAKAVAAHGQQLLWLAADFLMQDMEIASVFAKPLLVWRGASGRCKSNKGSCCLLELTKAHDASRLVMQLQHSSDRKIPSGVLSNCLSLL